MVLFLHIIGSNRTIALSLLKNPIYSWSHWLEIFSLNVLLKNPIYNADSKTWLFVSVKTETLSRKDNS